MDIYAQMQVRLGEFVLLAARAKDCYPHLEEQNEALIRKANMLAFQVDAVDFQTATPVYQ